MEILRFRFLYKISHGILLGEYVRLKWNPRVERFSHPFFAIQCCNNTSDSRLSILGCKNKERNLGQTCMQRDMYAEREGRKQVKQTLRAWLMQRESTPRTRDIADRFIKRACF